MTEQVLVNFGAFVMSDEDFARMEQVLLSTPLTFVASQKARAVMIHYDTYEGLVGLLRQLTEQNEELKARVKNLEDRMQRGEQSWLPYTS
jgi:hypothetical protein